MADDARPDGKRLMLLGIALIVLGVISILAPAMAGGAVVIVIGLVMLIAGVAQIVQAMRAESMRHKIMPLILGGITTLAGVGVLAHPVLGMGVLTLLLLIFFVVEGLWKIIASFSYRPAEGWVWLLLGGLLSLVLGVLIWNQWPVSGMWAVGVLVGVDLLSTGLAMVVLATTLKRLAPE